jgi:hypothetical protein
MAVILMLLATTVLATVPYANAATKMVETFTFIAVAPDPVGVNQQLLVTYRIDKVSPNAGALGAGTMFTGFTVKITKPDGTVYNKTGLSTDPTSNGWFIYVPTVAGQYTLQTIFPGQRINGTSFGFFGMTAYDNTYLPSVSAIITINVTQEQVQPLPDNPFPSGYWTTPIFGENKGWSRQGADNWLMQGYDFMSRSFGSGNNAFAPYTKAPNSAHIIWTKPIMLGGVVGGPFGDINYYQGLSYEEHYNPLILNGKIIFTEHYLDQSTNFQTRCVDLYTGEDVWILNNTNISFAQVVEVDTPNEHGALAYLWDAGAGGLFGATSTTWKMFDAFTGRYMCSIANVTWGGAGGFGVSTAIPGPKGEILAYTINSTSKRMVLWNSTKVLYNPTFLDTWGPTLGSTYDGRRGIEWNITIPSVTTGASLQEVRDGYAYIVYTDSSTVPSTYVDSVYDLKTMKKESGNYPTTLSPLWVANRSNMLQTFYIPGPIGSGIYTFYDESRLIMHAYDIRTGEEKWATEPFTSGWASFNWQWQIAYDLLFISGYDGHLRAYRTSDGSLAWDYYFGSAGYENPYGTFPVYSGFNVADGKIYVTNDEHSPDAIPWRGGKLWCFDARNGTLLWSISGKLRMGAISNGYLTSLQSLDGQIYTFGKGPSKTTVATSQVGVPKGSTVLISGSVTDQSPGQSNTPAISDADMTPWMEYLHMQKPFPANATGVPVKVTAIDPNGAPVDIGTVTSDNGGTFGIGFTPTVEGKYQIKATFEGTYSYGDSYATAYLIVGAAPSASPSAPPTSAPPTAPPPTQTVSPSQSPSQPPAPEETPNTALYVGIAAVVVIVVIAAVALFLRRRK